MGKKTTEIPICRARKIESIIGVQWGQKNPNPRAHRSSGKRGLSSFPLNGGTECWDFSGPTEHQRSILFSQIQDVDKITNTKFSNCPIVFKIGVVGSKICTAGNKIRFKVIHHLQYRGKVHFLLLLLILRLNIGCRLGQTLSKCISSFKKVKVLKC